MNWLTFRIWIYLQIAEASTYSCSISRQTVHHVDRCPKTEEEWKEAAERKNCSRYAHHCTEPEKLLYHCVVNPYVNQTLEVCAIRKNMIGGMEIFWVKLPDTFRCSDFIPFHLTQWVFFSDHLSSFCLYVFSLITVSEFFWLPVVCHYSVHLKGFCCLFSFLLWVDICCCTLSVMHQHLEQYASTSSQELLGQSLPNLVCSICRVRKHELVNVCKCEPFWQESLVLMWQIRPLYLCLDSTWHCDHIVRPYFVLKHFGCDTITQRVLLVQLSNVVQNCLTTRGRNLEILRMYHFVCLFVCQHLCFQQFLFNFVKGTLINLNLIYIWYILICTRYVHFCCVLVF